MSAAPGALLAAAELPEQLPGEPPPRRAAGLGLWARVLGGLVAAGLAGLAALPLWPLLFALAAVYGWPPNVPRRAQIGRYLRAILSARPPPGPPPGERAWLAVRVLWKAALIPVDGGAWLLDELLYGRRLDAVTVEAPLFEISAGRSGSTQLAHHLEDDPALAAPTLLQSVFPYLWAWRLAAATLGRVLPPARVTAALHARLPPEFLERHEADPFRTDTFDGALFLSHLNGLSLFVGPEFAAAELAMGRAAPHNRGLWERTFVQLLDRIGRKHLLWVGAPRGERRLFVKGHFLAAAPALAARFPDARFLTVIRAPGPRLQSAINYLRANPLDPVLGAPRWGWLAQAVLATERDYCEAELAWYTAPVGPRRCVVRFDDYVRDLPGTMARIYAECLDGPVSAHAPTAHPPRRRSGYRLDRSLAQLGIDEAELHQRLDAYLRWCKG
jgi:hypothetical protein